jgi:hypothetical protein
MATKTFHLLNTTAAAPNWFGSLQDGGSAPAAALSVFGWTVAKSSTVYWRARIGATARATVAAATSYIDSTTAPAAGTGSGATTAGDSFISPSAYIGEFSAGNWSFSFGMRTGAATCTGRIRCQVFASQNANGSGARELTTTALQGSQVTMNATGTTFASTVTWAAPAITLDNEYLFVQVEWQVTGAGTSNSCTAQFYQSAGSITTPNFTEGPVTGNLDATENSDSVSGDADLVVAGALDTTETADTVDGEVFVRIVGALDATEGGDTLSASASVVDTINASLDSVEDADTLSASAHVVESASGDLDSVEDADSIDASATVAIVAALSLIEADDGMSGNAAILVSAALDAVEDGDILSAMGIHDITGMLDSDEDDDFVGGNASAIVAGILNSVEDGDELLATGGSPRPSRPAAALLIGP